MNRITTLVTAVLLFAFAGDLFAQAAKQQAKKKGRPPAITWVNEMGDKRLPRRTQHLTFESKLAGREVGYCIYLPDEYESSPTKRFPVIYNLHGNGGNEFTGFQSIEVLDEGIQSGRWPAVIMVLPNGGHSTFYKDSADGRFPIESIFIKELIPFIDQTYRTIPDGNARCIEGFSMGGRGSTRLAVKYPEIFCSLFCQAGNVPNLLEALDPSNPEDYPMSYLGTDRKVYEENDVYFLLAKNKKRIREGLRIQIACGTKDGGHLPTIRDFHNALLDQKIDHTYLEIEGLGHRRTEMINLYRPIWFDYHIESLWRSGALTKESGKEPRNTPKTRK
ncbi:MAG: alpha/beta hydrolase-fold protein [Planctomycetota bacterium]